MYAKLVCALVDGFFGRHSGWSPASLITRQARQLLGTAQTERKNKGSEVV
jgi:hypothetical protein